MDEDNPSYTIPPKTITHYITKTICTVKINLIHETHYTQQSLRNQHYFFTLNRVMHNFIWKALFLTHPHTYSKSQHSNLYIITSVVKIYIPMFNLVIVKSIMYIILSRSLEEIS